MSQQIHKQDLKYSTYSTQKGGFENFREDKMHASLSPKKVSRKDWIRNQLLLCPQVVQLKKSERQYHNMYEQTLQTKQFFKQKLRLQIDKTTQFQNNASYLNLKLKQLLQIINSFQKKYNLFNLTSRVEQFQEMQVLEVSFRFSQTLQQNIQHLLSYIKNQNQILGALQLKVDQRQQMIFELEQKLSEFQKQKRILDSYILTLQDQKQGLKEVISQSCILIFEQQIQSQITQDIINQARNLLKTYEKKVQFPKKMQNIKVCSRKKQLKSKYSKQANTKQFSFQQINS